MPDQSVAEFRTLYDSVLERWPRGTVLTNVSGRFGTTTVITCGSDADEPVVLLAGSGATAASWFANAHGLVSAGYAVYAIDLIGDIGSSAGVVGPQDVDELLAWLFETMSGLGLSSASIVGHSYGAIVALAAALADSSRVQRLVLLDPNSCFGGIDVRYIAHAAALLIHPTGARCRKLLLWESGGQYDEQMLDLVAAGTDVGRSSKTIVPKRPSRRRLGTLSVPLTVVLAPESRVHDVERVARNAARAVPSADVVFLSRGSHHRLPWDPAGEVTAAILAGLGVDR